MEKLNKILLAGQSALAAHLCAHKRFIDRHRSEANGIFVQTR
ncbi:MAG: hypothetical protein PHC46_04760 [Clostridia bacterium]|jgi:hypothetical protein|nr:hypothetical protein [Clostridia bacterium]